MQTNLSLNSVLLKEAERLGVNVVHSAEEGITEAVKLHKQENWLKDNAEAIASSNTYVEANGLPLAKYRQF
ncbi:type II toxin-antitoxin system CcdA family antitoxin [Marinospirillum minutulum]|uniref:type II toxin-antitoxin system CcdA family antitoxin n=1 Tax=Marinospirillum minutulum TaxID=64974 RepID=UPI0004841EC1|nr:type II toxin-antitoxin system CcdA family antitoxin [Marinospirillum minutulum]